MTFETERLVIRPFAEADIYTIYQLVYADADVRRWWSAFDGTLDTFQERFHTAKQWAIEHGFGYWALIRKSDGQLLGLMGFQNHADEPMDWLVLPDGSRTVGHVPGCVDAELTYALGRAYWHQGYAVEAGRALLDYGFNTVGIDRVINAISPANQRSRNLMVRLGFVLLDNGNPQDLIGMLVNPARAQPPEP
jgi:RimJ/RimL family protein N-acetyltransferase